jgi:hypothetical protein
MLCPNCGHTDTGNVWTCPQCGAHIPGGIVLVTGIAGSNAAAILREVAREAKDDGHAVRVHDIGELMKHHAEHDQTGVEWDRILDVSPRFLRLLRALAFADVERVIADYPECLHIVDIHLCFRWYAYLAPGFRPYLIRAFMPHVRLLVNIIQDLDVVQKHLEGTAWGVRPILELLFWRDEERFLTDVYAGMCGGVTSYAVSAAEPPSVIERLIWHPQMKQVYLSFPMTAIQKDMELKQEIVDFRDEIRGFLIVFDPASCLDYNRTYERPDMRVVREQIGQTTIERDFRYIDQADAVVVYFPKNVPSKGVDAEMRYAFESGKPVYHYCPEKYDYGPFQPVAARTSNNRNEYVALLRRELGAKGGTVE